MASPRSGRDTAFLSATDQSQSAVAPALRDCRPREAGRCPPNGGLTSALHSGSAAPRTGSARLSMSAKYGVRWQVRAAGATPLSSAPKIIPKAPPSYGVRFLESALVSALSVSTTAPSRRRDGKRVQEPALHTCSPPQHQRCPPVLTVPGKPQHQRSPPVLTVPGKPPTHSYGGSGSISIVGLRHQRGRSGSPEVSSTHSSSSSSHFKDMAAGVTIFTGSLERPAKKMIASSGLK